MGLDMYLTKETYISKYAPEGEKTPRDKLRIIGVKGVRPSRVCRIVEDMGYWRKANAIHNWFVQNCQDGRDECQDTHVSIDDLESLYHVCLKVLKDNSLAEELLPTISGFFFGSTEYDEYYFADIQDTAESLEEIIKAHDGEKDGFYIDYVYSSSW